MEGCDDFGGGGQDACAGDGGEEGAEAQDGDDYDLLFVGEFGVDFVAFFVVIIVVAGAGGVVGRDVGADMFEFCSLAFGVFDAVASRSSLAFDIGLLVGLAALGMFGIVLSWVWLPRCDFVGLGSSEYGHLLGRLFVAHFRVVYAVDDSIRCSVSSDPLWR